VFQKGIGAHKDRGDGMVARRLALNNEIQCAGRGMWRCVCAVAVRGCPDVCDLL
jgi:hypothetical protein